MDIMNIQTILNRSRRHEKKKIQFSENSIPTQVMRLTTLKWSSTHKITSKSRLS